VRALRADEGAPTCWRARGYVDGLGWLEAWGTSLIDAGDH
jgi:hypothetical protein